jgi:phospholipid/cholesterol/gamma-HCH transport system substrate-binding protein
MKRSTRVKWGEIRVGLLIAIALTIFVWASFTGGGLTIFESKIDYHAYFDNVDGLVSGAPVRLAGVEVGNVHSIEFVNIDTARLIEIDIRVKRSIMNMVTADSKVMLGTLGLLGDKYIEIIPGSPNLPVHREGSVIQTAQTRGFSAFLDEGEEVMTDTGRLMRNLSIITGRMKAGEGTVGQLIYNEELYTELTKLASAMTVLMENLQKNQARITEAIEGMSSNLEDISRKVDDNTGTIGRLVNEPGLYDNLHSSTGRIDSILSKINQGRGTAGAMVNDDELYQDIKNLIVRIDNLVSDIEKNPRKYFKFSVF